MNDEKQAETGCAQDAWDGVKVAIRKRLRETGALVMIVGGAVVASPASAASSSCGDASLAPAISITDRIKRIRETSAGAAESSNDLGRVGPGVTAWNDHWRDHWKNIHWSNHWNNHHWSDHWNNHRR